MLMLGSAIFLAGVAYSFTDTFKDPEMNLRKYMCDFNNCSSWAAFSACCCGIMKCTGCKLGCPKIPESYKACSCFNKCTEGLCLRSCLPKDGCQSCCPKSCCPEGGICKSCSGC